MTMKKLGLTTLLALALAAVAVSTAGARHQGTTISGAGSTFVQPLVSQWISPLGSAYGDELQYSGVGSGAGVAAITSRTVDFGASDAPLSPDQFSACNGCEQIPWALGATSVMYNLPGVKNLLHMDGPTLAKIFMGQITTWNDPAIAKLNAGRVAAEHEDLDRAPLGQLGHDLQLHRLPVQRQPGLEVAGRQRRRRQLAGRLGRQGQLRCGRARLPDARLDRLRRRGLRDHNHLSYFTMKNRSGKFADAGPARDAVGRLSDVKPAADNSLSIVNPPKKYANAYPISTFTYVIVPLQSSKAPDLKKFLFWAVTKGQTYGPKLLFAPLPKTVLVVAEKAIAKIHS